MKPILIGLPLANQSHFIDFMELNMEKLSLLLSQPIKTQEQFIPCHHWLIQMLDSDWLIQTFLVLFELIYDFNVVLLRVQTVTFLIFTIYDEIVKNVYLSGRYCIQLLVIFLLF